MSERQAPNDAKPEAPASPSETSAEATPPAEPEGKLVRNTSLSLLLLCTLIFVWYLGAERYTPNTDNARVRAYVLPLASQVAGRIDEIRVVNNQVVEQGEVVLRIEQERYQLAVRKAEADLALAGQEVGAGTANVASAQARLIEAVTNLNNIKADVARVLAVAEEGYVSQTDVDRARASLSNAQAGVDKAQADLEVAKQQAGIDDERNPKVQRALTALGQARLDLENTEVRAPRLGLVSNLRYDVGYYANPGQPLVTFISTRDVWVEAYLRENNLEHIAPGDPVEMVLDAAPGRVMKGEVVSVSYGVQFETGSAVGSLPDPVTTTGWLRDPERFPVLIRFTDEDSKGFRREGGQADIIIYTDQAWLLRGIGWAWIRLLSLISYVY
ncbi:secretion protein HlyD family protein [Ferrimonas balearica DSM 9799]|uniref:Secretion protein HlyD family protein n=1 Tax=Ferrimonas balearica (strain DSM 9799 / CCM 4581 / KCTC 23876 / PAT) TaxID=550540 RepID=E1SSR5_FERBD|nr:HlyD family secretion protein [Ferrimonas balearica]ADN77069.1 secretion protein HlyD family protein [Ferrimonas balearica DSM 9799]